MKTEKSVLFLVGVIAVSMLCSLSGYSDELPYEETRQGNYTYLNPFTHKPATSEAHWDYAQSLREQGKTGAARKQFEIFVKRWPDSPRSAAAQQAVGDLYFEQGKSKKAFEAYETLIQRYYTGIRKYDSVLENQLAIAEKEMERKRMRWMFGGYSAPERAIPYLESIIRNAPQWDRTPEMQYRIGQAYQKNENHEMAIAAYTIVEYRYPDSAVAEEAAFSKIISLRELVRSTPYSLDIREQAELAVDMFKQTYPDSLHRTEVDAFGRALYNASARATYEIGEFYERVPKPPRNESARIYYEKVIELYGGTEYAILAAERLRALFPGSVTPEGELVKPKIFVVPEETVAQEAAEAAAIAESGSGEVVTHPLPERLVNDPEAIEVTADRMEYEGDLLIADGRVSLQQQGASLRADHVTVNHKTGEVIASGNIVMLRDSDLWEGQELVYNYKTRQGTFGESSMYFEPVYVTAEETERVSSNEYVMYNARITTCSGDKPIIYAKAKEVRVLDEDKPSGLFIKARHVTFYIKGVPVLYTPVWQRHLGYRIFTFSVGYGGNLGVFFMGRAELHPTDWLTTQTHFDYFSARGAGVGQDFFWETKNGGGSLQTYCINDASPDESAETPAEAALTDTTRYRVKITHDEQINDETYFITKLNYLSDPFILEDFFDDEFRKNANPENYAVIQHANDDYAASLRADKRLNDFYTAVDRMPELEFNWYRSQVADSPFYFQSDNSLAYLSYNGETNLTPMAVSTNYSSVRADTYNQLFLPLRFNDFYNVIPRVAYRGTWYSDTPGGPAEYRNIFEAGVLTSYKAYKTLTEKSGYYGDGLRHIIEPYADYNYRYTDVIANNLYQFDGIDALNAENRVRVGLRNFIQTKRGNKRIANFLDADVFTSYRFDPTVGENAVGPIGADLELSLTDNFNIQSDLEYDWLNGGFNDFNLRGKFITDDLSEYALSYRYLNGERSLITPSFRLFPNADWSYEFYAQYDADLGEWRERKFLVNHKFDCLGMGLGIKLDEDDVPMIWVNFWLTAFPNTAPTVGR